MDTLPPVVARIVADARGFHSELDHAERKTHSVTGGIKKAFVALGVATAAVTFFKGAFQEAEEARKVTAQTNAVIKSTGGVARVTAADIDRLSASLSNKTGIDDEAIASGSNLLLTFTKVRNETGRGNDIFNQATKAALDMSVAMGTDMRSASLLVGKALNDPIKGMTALSRSGIQFTAQQKEQIQTLVASGRQLDAQKIILAELTTQFGGSAEAAASPAMKLKVAWDNLKESAGTALMPALQGVASFLGETLPKVLETARRWWTSFREGFSGDGMTEGLGSRWRVAMAAIGAAVRTLVEWFRANWPQIREVTTQVLTAVGAVISGFIDLVMTIWRNFGSQIVQVVMGAWQLVRGVVEGALKVIQGIVKVITGLIRGDWSLVWEGIKQILSGVWDAIKGIVTGGLNIIRGVISTVLEIIWGIFSGVWNRITGFFSATWEGLKSIVRTGIASVVDFFLAGAEWVLRGAARMLGWVPGVGGKLKEAAREFERFRDGVNIALGGIRDKKVSVEVSLATGRAVATGLGARYSPLGGNKGMLVPGVGNTDTVPAMLTPGEYVVNKNATKQYLPTLQWINAQGFQAGGFVNTGTRTPNVGAIMGPFGQAVDRLAIELAERYAKELFAGGGIPGGGGGAIGSGWRAITNYLSAVGVPYRITSTVRRGNPRSLHYTGQAVDMVSGNMMQIARTLLNIQGSLAELFYSPLGFSIKNGRRVPWLVEGHYDHVHAATFDRGGTLMPGANIAYNRTGRPEHLVPAGGGVEVENVTVIVNPWDDVDTLAVKLRDAFVRLGQTHDLGFNP